jgi:hypothetical protein
MSETAAVVHSSGGLDPLVIAKANGKLRMINGQLKEELEKLRREHDQLKVSSQKRDADFDELKAATDSNKLVKDNKGLLDQIRSLKHRSVIDTHLREEGIKPEAIEAFHRLSGYEAKDDDPDPETVKAFVAEKKSELAYLFGANGTPESPVERRPAPARGQGSRLGEGLRIKATQNDLRDPIWCGQNARALRERLVDLID